MTKTPDSNTCSTCKHWTPPDVPDYVPDDDDDDDEVYITFRDVYGVCRVADSRNGQPKMPLQPSCAMDASGYHAFLGTLPTFSCNRHESK